MLRWDHLYKSNVSKAGMNLQMYERYVDDSNQVALVPPPGTKYDNTTKKVFIDENITDMDESDDERTARVLTDIANDVLPGVTMEFNVLSRNTSGTMPILDMEICIDSQTGDILFEKL